MAELLTDIPSLAFPHEVDVLRFSSKEDFRVRLTLEDEELLDVTLTPDASGAAKLKGVMELLCESTDDSKSPMPMLTIGVDSISYSVRILPCRVRLSDSAARLSEKIFLTMSTNGVKLIPMGAVESLYWHDASGVSKMEVKTYWVQGGRIVKVKYDGFLVVKDGEICHASFSTKEMMAPADGCKLVQFTARAGQRTMTYVMADDGMHDAPTTGVRFQNCFGKWDNFYFYGKMEKEVKPEYTQTVDGAITCGYRFKCQPTMKAHTGPMTEAVARLFQDLCTSKKVRRMDNGTELTLTDCEFKPTNGYSDVLSGSLTWREAAEGCTFNPSTPVRTFDKTFDTTFD